MRRIYFYTHQIFTLYGCRKAIFFYIYVQLYRKTFARWFDFIETALPEGASDIFKVRLAMRAAFRFVNPQFSVSERIDVLISHYTTLIKMFSRRAMSDFLGGTEYQIAEMSGQGGKKYAFRVINEITKEGALRIVFVDIESKVILAYLSGVIGLNSNRLPVFWIGMLRGPGGGMENGRQLVVNSTRDLNGLRPKQAILHAASAAAEWFQAREIIAPSTENQIAIRNLFKGRKIYANHDSFWQEFTKEPVLNGCYHLPLPIPRRNLADVQQKRRKDWILRYERIDAVSASIKDALDALADPNTGTACQGANGEWKQQ